MLNIWLKDLDIFPNIALDILPDLDFDILPDLDLDILPDNDLNILPDIDLDNLPDIDLDILPDIDLDILWSRVFSNSKGSIRNLGRPHKSASYHHISILSHDQNPKTSTI